MKTEIIFNTNSIYKSIKQDGVFYKFIEEVDNKNGRFLNINDLYNYIIPYKDMVFWTR